MCIKWQKTAILMFAAHTGLIFGSLTKVRVQDIRMRNKRGSLCAVVFHLSGSICFFNVVKGLDVLMEQKNYTQDKKNVVLSSIGCTHDYLQDQILWFCFTQCKGCTVWKFSQKKWGYRIFFFKKVNYLALSLIQLLLV